MCGRFVLSTLPARSQLAFACAPPDGLVGRWNIRPDTQIPIVRGLGDGGRGAVFARWGLLGPWMRAANDPGRQVNALGETAAEKPMFRDSFKKGRCPSDGSLDTCAILTIAAPAPSCAPSITACR